MTLRRKYVITIICMLIFSLIGFDASSLSGDLKRYIVGWLSLGAVEISTGGVMLLVNAMFPIIFIELMEGIYLYKHYTMGSVYYFVRQKNLSHWYNKEAIKLLLLIFEIYFIYLALGYIFGCIVMTEAPTASTLCMVLCQCAMYTAYTYVFVLLINCMSIIMGTDIAYVIGVGIQLVLVMLLLIFSNTDVVPENEWILRFNPISCMIIVWHYIPGIDFEHMNKVGVDFDVSFSVAYLSLIGFMVYKIAGVLIVNRDIAMENKEEQG